MSAAGRADPNDRAATSPQPAQRPTVPGVGSESASSDVAGAEGASTEDLDVEGAELDRAWIEFSQARARLAEVMSDDELRAFGINVEVLDERP